MRAELIKQKVFKLVRSTEFGSEVVDLLFPEGSPLSFETELWDFKRKPPLLGVKPSQEVRDEHKHQTHELIKDIVSFHNSYGGFIVFGVEDSGANRILGCSETLDLGDISNRIRAQTGKNIEIYQDTLSIGGTDVLLLLVQRRKRSEEPVQFIKKAPTTPKNKSAYQKGAVYVRRQDECRPAISSAEDWAFLFSDRMISETETTVVKDIIPSNLPSRDPDMVRFVGREDELAILRSWVLDHRNPVKLISGIGGLGKTSVAYHFCEELAGAGVGDYEFVAWVSAKKTTYAALRGEMVKTTRHDFSTVNELLQRLIVLIAGESSVEDDADEEEYADILVDALSYRPSFIVVDDLDSLSPEEQRKCATILQEIGFRTVDREHSGSKLLLTSRLDQGLSPTSVVKISGLDVSAFNTHIDNLCDQFELQRFQPKLLKQIYAASSGSPLFASAIVRMASLGESPKEICETWSSHDGEDVREFAFKRELDRLSVGSASILFAVVKLGDVSSEELLEVIEISRRSLFDYINELQSFHLLGKKENDQGDIVLSTSKELIASAGILKKKLGPKAQEVERRCAVIRKNQGDQTREVGRTIRKIIQCWDEEEPDQALVLARDLSKRNPKNGDTWCILARAYLSVQPALFQKAEDACTNALRYSCSRSELFDYVVESKKGVGDWPGLKSYADRKRFKSNKRDPGLDAYLFSVGKLVGLAQLRGSYKEAANHALDGVKKISDKIHNSYLEKSFFTRLAREQNRLSDLALRNKKQSVERPRDHLSVSDLGFELVDNKIQTKEVVTSICFALGKWADDVKEKEVLDQAEADIIANNIRKLDRLSGLLQTSNRDLTDERLAISATQKQLGFLGASFR